MFQIKLSEATAARRRIPILLVDATDGYTPETGITTPTIKISKNGGTQATGTGTFTEIGTGQYYYEFASGEVDTLGWVAFNLQKSGTTRDYNAVVQVMAYDALDATRLGLSALPNAAAEASGGLITRGTGTGQITVSSGAVTVGTINTDVITGTSLNANAVEKIADNVLSRNVSNVEGTMGEHTLGTVVLATLENAISGTTLTIYRTNGSTTHATKTLTKTAASTADVITGVA